MSVDEPEAGPESAGGAGYPRSTGSPRGEARRVELLDRVTDDLVANGLVDFSLRRAARACGTSHKVLLYHFDGVDDLLRQAVAQLRQRRVVSGLAAAARPEAATLAQRVRALWSALVAEGSGPRVLDQAIGLTMYDPARYAVLGHEVSRTYLPALVSLCPSAWPEPRRVEVAHLILASLRGFLVEWITTGSTDGAEDGLDALCRALDREEADPA